MQISLNNLAPPNPGIGGIGGPDSRGKPEMSPDFREMVQQQQRRPALETRQEFKDKTPTASKENKLAARSSNNKPNGVAVVENDEVVEGENEGNPSLKVKPSNGKTKQASVKENAVLKFMDSLESELGISAERFSAALAQLPADVKAMPIEESAPFVVEQLGVPLAEQQGVTEVYVNLLQRHGITDQPIAVPELQESKMTQTDFFPQASLNSNNGNADLELPIKPTNRQKLNATIDELNRRFFDVKPKQMSSPLSMPGLDGLAQSNSSEAWGSLGTQGLQTQPQVYSSQVPLMDDLNNKYLDSLTQMTQPQKPFEAVGKGSGAMANDLLEDPGISTLSDLESLSYEVLNPELATQAESSIEAASLKKMAAPGIKTWSVEELPFLANAQGGELNQTAKTIDSSNNSKGFQFGEDTLGKFSKEEASEGRESIENLPNAFTIANDDGYEKNLNNQSVLRNNSNQNVVISPQDRSENLSKISNATEALATKGGGEMKVILTPEGLGTILLKVKMQEGKLQVEMKAQSKESQRLLESSLSDLKQNLSAHRLSIDSVKVDVGGDFTRQESSQSFAQPQFDMGRDQARQFMNLFREGNLSQRQTLFDAPGFKTYRTQKEEPLVPISSDIRPRASLSASKGKELNLVA